MNSVSSANNLCLNCSTDLDTDTSGSNNNSSAFYTLNCSSRVRSPFSLATVELIPVNHALATVFNLETLAKVSNTKSRSNVIGKGKEKNPLTDFQSSTCNVPICFSCYLVLSDLYRVYTEFNQLRKANSFLGSKLRKLEEELRLQGQGQAEDENANSSAPVPSTSDMTQSGLPPIVKNHGHSQVNPKGHAVTQPPFCNQIITPDETEEGLTDLDFVKPEVYEDEEENDEESEMDLDDNIGGVPEDEERDGGEHEDESQDMDPLSTQAKISMDQDSSLESVNTVLTQLNLVQYFDAFREHNLTDQIVAELTLKELEDVIKPLGHRKLFFTKFHSLTETISSSQVLPGETLAMSSNAVNSFIAECENSKTAFNDDQSQSYESAAEDSNCESVATSNNDSVHISQIVDPSFSWNFQDILTSMHKRTGHDLIKAVTKTSMMTVSQRKLVANTAASFLREKFGNYPSSEAKEQMALAIHTTFPCIKKEVWYFKTKGRNASGYLQYRIGNVRNKNLKGSKKKVLPIPKPAKATHKKDLLSPEDVENRRLWLKKYKEPAETVIKYLDETFWSRQQALNDPQNQTSLADQWPSILYSVHAVNGEFERNPAWRSASSQLYHKLEAIAPKILTYASMNRINIFDKLGLDTSVLLSDDQILAMELNGKLEMETDASKLLNGDKAILASFLVLPFIFNSGFQIRDKKRRRVSSVLSVKFLAQFYPVGTDLSEIAEKEKDRTRPFIIFLGNKNSLQVQQQFVLVERQIVECTSVTQAIDCCFKSHKIINAKWATECEAVWAFFESFVYEMEDVRNPQECLASFLK